jgi:hypothetical protein
MPASIVSRYRLPVFDDSVGLLNRSPHEVITECRVLSHDGDCFMFGYPAFRKAPCGLLCFGDSVDLLNRSLNEVKTECGVLSHDSDCYMFGHPAFRKASCELLAVRGDGGCRLA